MAALPLTVLLVEDEPACARAVQVGLGAQGMKVHVVGSLAEALASDAPVHVALIDPGLPDAQGLDALLRWIDEGRTEPVVIISGYLGDGFLEAVIAAGAEDAVEKGELSSAALGRRIRAAVARARRRASDPQRLCAGADACPTCKAAAEAARALARVERHTAAASYEVRLAGRPAGRLVGLAGRTNGAR